MKHLAFLFVIVALAGPASAEDVVSIPTPSAGTALAQKGDRANSGTEAERRKARLDLMFGRLAKATNKRRADRIARHIMRRMTQSGSDTVDLLMVRAAKAMQAKDLPMALDLLDGVVRLQPDYAEGWNRRATVYFLVGDYGRSMADIEQVLKREPRHWGALAGMAMILAALDRKDEAVVVMDHALEIHPHLEKMKEQRDRYAKENGGSDI
ncbi:tetratricopeptide repeat protein [Acuticoccus mangrovi]|uniref:Tetratricopeptide repeat protein n=1 Tax=Acuticoccus mangrovi TaxID=2796142 RepID=A0A934MEP6_9HYPH|nr:tetratricopeptide repeat protein [Acuticoccus mangrovi]MBJ3777762.1 tetratricopeptide repeat protein [Acuticoccus mangrovi]